MSSDVPFLTPGRPLEDGSDAGEATYSVTIKPWNHFGTRTYVSESFAAVLGLA